MDIALSDYVVTPVTKYNPNHDARGRFASGGGGGGVASGNRPVKDIQDMTHAAVILKFLNLGTIVESAPDTAAITILIANTLNLG